VNSFWVGTNLQALTLLEMNRLCAMDGTRFSVAIREDLSVDTFGHDDDLDDTNADFMMPRKVGRKSKQSV